MSGIDSRRPAAGASGHAEGDELSVRDLLRSITRHWRVLGLLPAVGGLLALLVAFVLPQEFTAIASFVPEPETRTPNLSGGLASIASDLGVGGLLPSGESPEFYGDILRSRTLADDLLRTRFADPRGHLPTDSTALVSILRMRGQTEAEQLERGRKKLTKIMAVAVKRQTNVVSVSVETNFPELSAAVANRAVALLGQFNLGTRHSRAQARRVFVQGRLTEATDELRAAEEEEQRFLERNRQFRGSPQLEFEYERLQRRVAIKQDVLATLNRQFEESRIQEVNDTPVITVIDQAVVPKRKSAPQRLLITALGALAGLILAAGVVFWRETLGPAEA